MRIPSGSTDRYIYFVAVDASDLKTRKTGLGSWTVVYSRNGSADTTYTTPTVTEVDAVTMPGLYALLLDEGTTIGGTHDTEEYVVHITDGASAMAPVTRSIELYRPETTEGETMTVGSGVGSANAVQISGDSGASDNLELFFDGTGYDAANSTVGNVTLVATTTAVTNQVAANVTAISGDTPAADNLESQYDGTGLTGDTYPATQSQIGNISSGTAATNTTADSVTVTTGVEVNAYTDTFSLDGTVHEVNPSGGNTEFYYEFDLGANGTPVSVQWEGYANLAGDAYSIYAYNWSGASWDQIGTISGSGTSTVVTEVFDLTTAHVGTGANIGLVRWRVVSTDGQGFNTDRVLCSFASVFRSVGYADGAIWVDTSASNTNTVAFVDGVADNPVSTWAAALTLSGTLGLVRFRIAAGSSITLTGDSTGYEILSGGLYSLALGGQTITDAYIKKASLSGTGAGSGVIFEDCQFNNSVSIPPSYTIRSGIAAGSGTPLVANGAGEYVFVDCVSLVAGSGTPYFDFSGTGGSSGVNFRRWSGGTNITLDSNNSLSLEVVGGGGQTIVTGGASCELRGIMRAVTVTMSSTETVQFVGVTGPIALSGTTTGTVNLHGVSTSLSDTTSGATVNDNTVRRTEQDSVIADVAALNDPTSADIADAVWDEAKAGHVGAGSFGEDVQSHSLSTEISALNDLSAAEVNAEVVDVLRTDTIPDSYAADGAQPTIVQAILAIKQFLEERSVSGTTVTVKKPDGSTTAMTFTLDDAVTPQSITRSS